MLKLRDLKFKTVTSGENSGGRGFVGNVFRGHVAPAGSARSFYEAVISIRCTES